MCPIFFYLLHIIILTDDHVEHSILNHSCVVQWYFDQSIVHSVHGHLVAHRCLLLPYVIAEYSVSSLSIDSKRRALRWNTKPMSLFQ